MKNDFDRVHSEGKVQDLFWKSEESNFLASLSAYADAPSDRIVRNALKLYEFNNCEVSVPVDYVLTINDNVDKEFKRAAVEHLVELPSYF